VFLSSAPWIFFGFSIGKESWRSFGACAKTLRHCAWRIDRNEPQKLIFLSGIPNVVELSRRSSL
jgi:hypothetical protein